jgi:flagellar basal body P-ring formation protein FlgA
MPFFRVFFLALLASASMMLQAQTFITTDELQAFALQQAQFAAQGSVTRMDVRLGSMDAQQALAPCRRVEPFVPAGSRLWGRASIGVRCMEGAAWSVLVPVTVTAWGKAWVAASSLPAGTTLDASHLREDEIELTRERPGLPTGMEALLGKVLVRPVQPGQALHTEAVRSANVVASGDVVRLRVLGGGFAITASGQSLGSAAEGQPVRVRTDFGRTVTGLARNGRIVDIQP